MAHIIEQIRKNVAYQISELKRYFPDAKYEIQGNRTFIWKSGIKPSELSDIYIIKIKYSSSEGPKVYVLDPNLVIPKDRSLIHLNYDDTLCLFIFGEWQKDMSIAETIIPWTSEWLLYYEIWLATGKWLGGG